MGQENRRAVLVVKIICLDREESGTASHKLQREFMNFAEKEKINCIVDIVWRSTIQFTGKFEGYVHLEICHNGHNMAILKKIEDLTKRGYSLQLTDAIFPSD
jgi:hypothetical protein